MAEQKKALQLAALSGVPLVMVLGNSMLIPVLSQMQQALHISPLQAGLTITMFSLPAGLCIPLLGGLADRFGRKRIIVPSLITYGLGGMVSGLAVWLLPAPYPVMLAGRVLQGIGAAGTAPVAMALVGDLFQQQDRSQALGVIEAANGAGKVISPILGALIALVFWYLLFFVYALLAVPVAAAVWWMIKEPPLPANNRSLSGYLREIKAVFREKGRFLAGCYLAGGVALLILFGILAHLSDVLESRYHLTGVVKGLALAVPVLVMSVTSYLSGRLLQKRSHLLRGFTLGGLCILTAAVPAVTLLPGSWLLFAGTVLIGLGTGAILPPVNTLVTGAVPVKERGGITALYGSARFLGVALGPPLFSLLLTAGATLAFTAGIALAGLTTALVWWALGQGQPTVTPAGARAGVFRASIGASGLTHRLIKRISWRLKKLLGNI